MLNNIVENKQVIPAGNHLHLNIDLLVEIKLLFMPLELPGVNGSSLATEMSYKL